MQSSVFRCNLLVVPFAIVFSILQSGAAHAEDPASPNTIPLSPAQRVLFETPHLSNVARPETLRYQYRRIGPDAFSDTIGVDITKLNADGTKNVAFDYLTGAHHVAFPAMDNFRGNPLLMLVLDRDVVMMKAAVGMSEAFFRNHIRQSFLDAATVTETTIPFEGAQIKARTIVVTPFSHEDRFEHIRSLQAKTYSFTLADTVPGMIADITIHTPADPPLQAPEFTEQVTFEGVKP